MRIVDAIPDRGTTGPKLATWLDEHLLANLDKEFRCYRPCHVLPQWTMQAGFSMIDQGAIDFVRYLRLPAAVAQDSDDLAAKIACTVLRELWRDGWGEYVGILDGSDSRYWWWDDAEILEECLEWKTGWDVGWLVVMKDANK
jgi:hypothetical protein